MRNRTELVTNTLAESDNEEEELDDSEEDWKPAKKGGRGAPKVVSPKGGKRKSAGRARPASKKTKKEESEEEVEEEEEIDDDEYFENDSDDEEDSEGEAGTKGKAARKRSRAGPPGKNQPDKDGVMELYLFKNDLTKEFRSDVKLCLWRRDGASLLQKYLVVKNGDEAGDMYFNASSVYSCWEEKRKNDFFQIRVLLIGDKKDGKVKVINMEELEKFAAEEREQVDITHKGANAQATGGDEDGNDDGNDAAFDDGDEDEDEEEE